MELWHSRKIYPNKLKLNNIVEATHPKSSQPGLICLSGGIDSTFAALECQNEHNISHGLLIAGADYPSKDSPGFISLKSRVDKIASTLNLDLVVVETSIRKHGFQWEMLHTLNLAMCLNLNAHQFGFGVIAASLRIFETIEFSSLEVIVAKCPPFSLAKIFASSHDTGSGVKLIHTPYNP